MAESFSSNLDVQEDLRAFRNRVGEEFRECNDDGLKRAMQLVESLNTEEMTAVRAGNLARYKTGIVLNFFKENVRHGDFERQCADRFKGRRGFSKTSLSNYRKYALIEDIEDYLEVQYDKMVRLVRLSGKDGKVQIRELLEDLGFKSVDDIKINNEDVKDKFKAVNIQKFFAGKSNPITLEQALSLVRLGYDTPQKAWKKISPYLTDRKTVDEAIKSIEAMAKPDNASTKKQNSDNNSDDNSDNKKSKAIDSTLFELDEMLSSSDTVIADRTKITENKIGEILNKLENFARLHYPKVGFVSRLFGSFFK